MLGLMIIITNALYILFSIIMGIVSYFILRMLSKRYEFLKRKRVYLSFLIALGVWVAPYYDLFIDKGIKTYYETFKMEPKIYAYPERDKDGKIESLDIADIHIFDRLNMLKKNGYADGNRWFNGKVKKFVEMSLYGVSNKIIRVKFNIKNNFYQIINPKNRKGRYRVTRHRKVILGLYSRTVFKVIDTKTNKLLATAWGLYFGDMNTKDRFRNKYLFLSGGNGIGFSIGRISNFNIMFKKLFDFKLY